MWHFLPACQPASQAGRQAALRCRSLCITVTRTLIKRSEWVRGGESSGVCYEGLVWSVWCPTLPLSDMQPARACEPLMLNFTVIFGRVLKDFVDFLTPPVFLEGGLVLAEEYLVCFWWNQRLPSAVWWSNVPSSSFCTQTFHLEGRCVAKSPSAVEHQPSPVSGIMGFWVISSQFQWNASIKQVD